MDADIVILGGGASGLSAAVAAAERGGKVILIEKSAAAGGAAKMGMGFFAVESKYQKKQLVDLSAEDAFNFLMEYTHWQVDARLVSRYINMSANTVDWVESMGVSFLGAFKIFPSSKQTWHIPKVEGSDSPVGGAGKHIFTAMTKRAEELGVQIRYNTVGSQILIENDHVTGVEITNETGKNEQLKCRSVIVATGGFGDNPQMIKERTGYEWGKDLHSIRVPGTSGDGLSMMWGIGAVKTGTVLELIYSAPGFGANHKTLSEIMRQPGLMVNIDGQRFINEEVMINPVFTGNAISRQKERVAFTIADDSILELYFAHGLDYAGKYDDDNLYEKWKSEFESYLDLGDNLFAADTLEELCEMTGINLCNMKKTIDEYNKFSTIGDLQFFKKHKYIKPFKGGKLYASKHYPSALGTLGGVQVNDKMEVLRDCGSKIPGLYSCGTDACNIFGDSYCFHLPGNTMGFAINSGRIAGYEAVHISKNT
ncbi:MAG: FAD-dependent oxidoreductase [Defluviitaleaceae bacterium]|nr:FAD-dependent oxidoreductase [Defluviitaleaceae bacterium]